MGKNAKMAILKFAVICFFTRDYCEDIFPIKSLYNTVFAVNIVVVFSEKL